MNVLSLCSGIAGLDLGVRLACSDAQTVCYVEIDPFCQDILLARMADGILDRAPIWGDLRTFSGRQWRGVVDCVVSGFPCQPFSVAGKRKGDADARNLWLDLRRVITESEPAIVFLENVPGAMPYFYHVVLPELQGLGYAVEAGLFTAAEVGAPHRRQRLFVLGYAGSKRGREYTGTEAEPTSDWANDRLPGSAGSDVAYHEILSRQDGASEGERPGRLASGGETLADSYGGRQVECDARERRLSESNASGGANMGHPGEPGSSGRSSESRNDGAERATAERAGSDGIPLWPPGPAERGWWTAIIERWPWLAPAVAYGANPRRTQCNVSERSRLGGNGAVDPNWRGGGAKDNIAPQPDIRGVADGLPDWLVRANIDRRKRLQALGNAVVPMTAVLAWVRLWTKVGIRK